MNTYKEVLHSPVFESLLTVQSEVRRVIRALVVPKRKDFHLDLTKKIESMTVLGKELNYYLDQIQD